MKNYTFIGGICIGSWKETPKFNKIFIETYKTKRSFVSQNGGSNSSFYKTIRIGMYSTVSKPNIPDYIFLYTDVNKAKKQVQALSEKLNIPLENRLI